MRESIIERDRWALDFTLSQADFYSQSRLDAARNEISKFYDLLEWENKPDFKPFCYAMVAYGRIQENMPQESPYICVTDFSKPNTDPRFFIINLQTLKVENALCVWHWKNSGTWEIPDKFSNKEWSLQSSLWAFKTSYKIQPNTKWTWKWLLLQWLENSDYRASSRGIYIHPWGVDQSEWCFTIPYKNEKEEVYNVIKKLEWWCLVYSYFNEESLKDSWIMNPTFNNILSMSRIPVHNIKSWVKSLASKTKSRIKEIFTSKKHKDTMRNPYTDNEVDKWNKKLQEAA